MRSRECVSRVPAVWIYALILGMAASSVHAETLVAKSDTWRYRKGTAEATPLDRSGWRTNGFNDGGWPSAQAPFGYGPAPENAWMNTTLSDMQNGYSSVFLRNTFTVSNPSDITALKLIICWDDGFIAWINGERVADRDEPASATYYALASDGHESWDPDAPTVPDYEDIWLDLEPTEIAQLLVAGNNVLTIQAFNQTLGSSDFFIDAKLRTAVADTKFSHDRGFYDSSFYVTIGTKTPGATIRYTTNGHWPTTTYGTIPGAPYTNARVNITKTTVLRAAAFHSLHHQTDVDTHTYIRVSDVVTQSEMDTDVINDSRYTGTIQNDLKSIPSMSIVGDPAFLTTDNGTTGFDEEDQRAVSLSLIYPDGSKGFQVNCGLRHTFTGAEGDYVSAAWTRKRSYNITFTGEYGPTTLRYPLMGKDYPVQRFNKLRLRAQGNDKWNHWEATYNGRAVAENGQLARDEFGRRAQLDMGWVSPQGLYVHLYINGRYRGLYNPCEKPTSSFMVSHYGGESADYDVLKQGYNVVSGNDTEFMNMINYAKSHNLATSSYYDQMKNYLDIPHFAEYILLEVWGPNGDWSTPSRSEAGNNWRAGKKTRYRQPGDPQFTFYMWDYEACLNMYPNGEFNTLAGLNHDMTGTGGPGGLHGELLANSDYKIRYADAIYRHLLDPRGALTPAATGARYQGVCDEIDRAVVGESARWGDGDTGENYFNPPMTRDDTWVPERNYMLNTYFPQRTGIVMTQFRNRGHYPSKEAPGFNQYGGEVVSGFVLRITASAGTIYYTSNGEDPRLSGGAINGNASVGTSPRTKTLTDTRHIKARVRQTGIWSALCEATFNVVYGATDLKLTEIMYKPRDQVSPSVQGEEFEFLEFKNTGSSAIDLSGYHLTGVDYTFPADTSVSAGNFLLVVRNLTQFDNRYPGVTCETLEWSDGGLSDGGEKVRLRNAQSNTVLSCEYDDDPPWPLGPDADGMGLSLVTTNPGGDPDNPENWRAGSNVDGSPGADDPAPSYGLGVMINEVMAHTDDTKGDKIELYNSGAGSVNITGWYLSDAYDAGNPGSDYKLKKWLIPSVTIPAGGYYVFYETNHTPAFGTAFQLNEWGDQVYLASASGGNLSGYIVGAEFGASENGVALGRYETSVGVEDFFPALMSWTLAFANDEPKVGPVVINEIMYNPPETGSCTNEYVELLNLTGSPVVLTGWDVEGAGGYVFPTTTIQANNYLILLDTNSSITPLAFRSAHSIPASVPIHGHNFDLGNNGEAIRLEMPNSDPDTNAPDILVDRVRYNDRIPWPPEAAGEGPSLERYVSDEYGNEPLNWRAHNDGGTPGAANSFASGLAVAKNSNWRYHDRGYGLGTVWQELDYSDSGWGEGDGLLGYGQAAIYTVVSYGPDSGNKYPTTYFRKEFMIAEDPGSVLDMTLSSRYDDGFVAYINGTEVARRGMSASNPMPYTELATLQNGSGGAYQNNDISAHIGNLVKGRNVLAVEVHQVSAGSSDLAWDAQLTYHVSGLPDVEVTIAPHGATFTDPINVTLSCDPTSATIHYTTDGSPPDTGDPTIPSGNSIQLTASTTVRALGTLVAYDDGTDSATFTHVLRTVSFATASSSAQEETGTVNLPVSLSTVSPSQVTVAYSVDVGSSTASAGSDFSLSAGTLTFAPGVATRNIALQILEDGEEETSETVVVQLDSASGAQIGGQDTHTHTIQDDDGPLLAWVAYNDLMWAATDPTANITLFSGWVTNGWMTSSGQLKNQSSGTNVGVTLSISNPGDYYEQYRTEQGGNANSGTDAYTNFFGIVGGFGNMAGNNNTVLTFAGLDTNSVYTLVVFGNRNAVAYTDRFTDYVLGGVDSFDNTSTPGVQILTNSIPGDMVRYCTGYNTVLGYVGRWVAIRPTGATMTLTVQGTHHYINAIRLESWTAEVEYIPPTVQFRAASSSDSENNTTPDLAVYLSHSSIYTTTVEYDRTGGTAATPGDFTLPSGTLTFPAGTTNLNITPTVVDDTRDEWNQTIIVTLSGPNTYCTLGSTLVHTYTIADEDPLPNVAFNSSTYTKTAPESGSQTITLELDRYSEKTVAIAYQTANGTATAGSDYTATSGSATFWATTTKTFDVPILPDSLDENNETVTLSLLGGTEYRCTLGTPNTATLTITDDDNPPTAQFSSSTYTKTAPESGSQTITVQLSTASAKTVQIGYQTANGTATAGSDYTTTAGTLVFTPGDVSETFAVPILVDTLDENNETVALSLNTPVNCSEGTPNSATLTITDDDAAPTVQFSSSTYTKTAPESGSQTITVQLSAASGKTVQIGYQTAPGTAAAGSDYTTASGTLVFTPGDVSETFAVSILGDALDEVNETVALSLNTPVNCSEGAPNSATLTITDDDNPPSIYFRDADISKPESGNRWHWVELSAESGREVTVDYATSDGTATAGADYTVTTGTLTFPAGSTNEYYTIPILEDSLDEVDETITATLSSPVNGTLGTPNPATMTITDDDDPPDVYFRDASFSRAESGDRGVWVQLSAESGREVTIDYATSDGTATAGEDYTATTGTLTFLPDSNETNTYFLVTILPDAKDEENETITFTLSNAGNADLGTPNPSSLTITDNDDPPVVQFRLAASQNSEALAAPAVEVYLDQESGFSAAVDYAASPGSATSPADYTLAAGTLTFQPGVTNLSITPGIVGDGIDESDEDFDIDLSGANAYCTLSGTVTHTYTILDDDNTSVVQFLLASSQNAESVGAPSFEVTLNPESAATATVVFAVSGGSATSPDDYTLTGGTLTFLPGITNQTITPSIVNDGIHENDETVTVELSGANSYCALGATATHIYTIQNDDAPPVVRFRVASSQNAESVAAPTVDAYLSQASSFTATVDYAASPGTATSPADYTLAGGTLTFAPGMTNLTVTPSVVDDGLDENDEDFDIVLSGANAYCTLGATTTHTCTIQDDDDPPVVQFRVASSQNAESVSAPPVEAYLSQESSFTATVDYAASPGTATSPADYTLVGGTLTFEPGMTNLIVTPNVVDDGLDEADEDFNVVLSGANAYCTLGATATHTYTIQNDDVPPVVQFRVGSSQNAESVAASIEVYLGQESSFTATVDYAASPGTATSPADYTLVGGTLTFQPGMTNLTVTPSVADDGLNESDEAFDVVLSGANAYCTLGGVVTHTYIIQNDDAAPAVSFDAAKTFRVTEYYLTTGDFAGTDYNLTLDQDLAVDYFVLVRGSRTDDATSHPDNDYARVDAVPGGRGELAASSGADVIRLSRYTADATWEGVVTVVECLGDKAAGGFTLLDIVETTFNDTDTSGTDSSTAWTDIDQVTLFGGYRGGGAEFSEDALRNDSWTDTDACSVFMRLYPSATGTLNWQRQLASGATNLESGVMSTFVVEWGSEWMVQRVLVSGSNGGDGVDQAGHYTTASISSVARDNTWVWGTGSHADGGVGDCAEACVVTLGDGVNQNATETSVAVGSEHTDAYAFDVYVMTHAGLQVDHRFKADGDQYVLDLAVPVDHARGPKFAWSYNTADGTTAAFPRSTFWARYTDDAEITLSRGNDGQAFCAWVQGIDLADLTHTPASYQAVESAGSVALAVTLSEPSAQEVTVNYDTTPVTATAGADYAAINGTLTWAAGESGDRTITVVILEDGIDETDETFTVDLSGQVNCTVFGASTRSVTIIDNDDLPLVQFRQASSSNGEDVGAPTIAVYLSGESVFTATVDYTATDVAAASPADYTLAGGTLTFLPGVTNLTLTPSIVDDGLSESDEAFDIDLSGPNAYCTLGATVTHTYTIQDNEGIPAVSFDAAQTFRVTEYYLTTGDFSGTDYDLVLDQDLAADYFILVRGSRTDDGSSHPDNDYARVDAVPGGRGELAVSSGADVIRLSRYAADVTWEGVVTVVECQGDKTAGGFTLLDIVQTSFNDTDTSGTDSSTAWTDIDQVTLFGGYRGGGAEFSEDASRYDNWTDTDACSLFMRLYPSATGTLNWQRQLATGATNLESGVMSTFVVEWGSEWTVQRVLVSGSNGGDGVDQAGHYTTAAISSVARGNTWVWGTGTHADGGIGDCAEGCVVTLGDGVTQNATETSVAVGSEYTDAYNFDVYVMTHAGLQVDYRFKADGDQYVLDLAVPVDPAGGQKFAWSYNTADNTITAFPRSTFWSRYTAAAEITLSRGNDGQEFCAWLQGIDLTALTHTPVSYQVAESAGSAALTVTLLEPSGQEVTVDYDTAPITATAGADYTAVSGTLTWAPGESGARTITVVILDDGLDESDEAFSVDLSGQANCTIAGTHSRTVTIVDDDEPSVVWNYRNGLSEASSPAADWRRPAFDDSGWLSGAAPLGYGAPGIVTTLADMQGNYSCVFLRQTFDVPNPALVKQIDLQVDYDDAFLVWINGEEVARVNMAGSPGEVVPYTTLALGSASAAWSNTLTKAAMPLLFKGNNVMAVQVFNVGIADADLIIDVAFQLLQGSSLSGTVDADTDGMADQWESDNIPGGDGAPDVDGDGDGALNLDEFVGGTDPDSAQSLFRINAAFVGGEVVISVPTVEAVGAIYEGQNRYYSLQEKPLQGGTFQTLPGYNAILGQGQTVVYTNVSSVLDKDYRGRVWLE